MGFRFQKRIRIFKGLTLNLSKSGTSWTVGGPGASVNLRGKKVTGTVGVPGTGVSYRQDLTSAGAQPAPADDRPRSSGGSWLFWIVVVVVVVVVVAYVFGR